ncbi:MAG: hypothetical protein RL141_92 [Candidatus Parcubacteria bacterium]
MFRLADIEVEQSQLDDKIVGTFRFESSAPQKHGPMLLAITEINGTGYVYDQLIDVINHEAEKSRALTIGVDADPVSRFEKIVQNINRAVADFTAHEPTPINWTRVNMFLLELSQGHVCLTGVGQLMNMFLQQQEDGTFKTYDLFGSLEQPPDTDPEKLFRAIICGDMNVGDVLIAGTRNLERFRHELRLKERLATLPPVAAAQDIKQELERQGVPDDFVATIIACLPADETRATAAPAPAAPAKGLCTASIEKLREAEADAGRQTGPMILPSSSQATGGRHQDTGKGEPLAPFLQGALGIVGRVRRMVTREKVRDVAMMTSLRGMNAGFGTFFTRKRKTILMAAGVLTVLIIGGGSAIKYQRNAAAERAAWNETYDQARATIERASGEDVYSEERARRSLAEADDLIASLTEVTDEQKEALQTLRDMAGGLREKLRRAVVVDQPAQLYALPDGLPDGTLVSPIFFKGSLVAADRSSNALIVINLETKEAERIALSVGETAHITAIAAGQSSVIVALDDGSLLATNITNGQTAPLTLGDGEAEAMTDITAYGSRLYRLDAAKGQIWRYPSATGGFGAEQSYLQAASTNLNDAVSLTIDSNVYVLKANGTLVRFFSGGQDGFSLPAIDPPLTNANALWSADDAESQYLAIADKTGKRILLFTKEGRLAAQFTSPAFAGPTDLLADEASKKLYAVDGNKLLEIPLP